MLDFNKDMCIFDDTGDGDVFNVEHVLYKDDDVAVCTVANEWYDSPLKVLINLDNNSVMHRELDFYYAKNV